MLVLHQLKHMCTLHMALLQTGFMSSWPTPLPSLFAAAFVHTFCVSGKENVHTETGCKKVDVKIPLRHALRKDKWGFIWRSAAGVQQHLRLRQGGVQQHLRLRQGGVQQHLRLRQHFSPFLTTSLPWCHLKTTHKRAKFEIKIKMDDGVDTSLASEGIWPICWLVGGAVLSLGSRMI